MAVINRVYANAYSSLDATLLNIFFQMISPGLDEPCFMLKFVNSSNVNILISYDGIYPNDVVPASSQVVLPFQKNSRTKSDIALMKRGIPIYVAAEEHPGKTGYIHVISYYQPVTGT